MLPFLVDTARLYELFVAEWLRAHLPEEVSMVAQEPVIVDDALCFNLDVVLYDSATVSALCALDTKYKAASAPSAEEVEQVVAYAEAKGCREAVLVYPNALSRSLDARVGKSGCARLPSSQQRRVGPCGGSVREYAVGSGGLPASRTSQEACLGDQTRKSLGPSRLPESPVSWASAPPVWFVIGGCVVLQLPRALLPRHG